MTLLEEEHSDPSKVCGGRDGGGLEEEEALTQGLPAAGDKEGVEQP